MYGYNKAARFELSFQSRRRLANGASQRPMSDNRVDLVRTGYNLKISMQKPLCGNSMRTRKVNSVARHHGVPLEEAGTTGYPWIHMRYQHVKKAESRFDSWPVGDVDDTVAVRATLRMIREEFRRLAFSSPPLYHDLFRSPLPVTREGWLRFAEDNRAKGSDWEYWHSPPDGAWLGRFWGHEGGLKELHLLTKSLALVLPPLDWFAPLEPWLGVLHNMADFTPTPLLYSTRSVWDWEPSEHIDDTGAIELVDPHLEEWAEELPDEVHIPKHPLHRQLAFNVFTSSIVAIETILDPGASYLKEGFQYADLPIVLRLVDGADEQPTLPAFDGEELTSSNPDDILARDRLEQLPAFLFRRSGDTWTIRFQSGKAAEIGTFTQMKGFEHYYKLLMTPYKELRCIDLDPRGPVTTQRSSISLGEHLAASGEVDTFSGIREEGAIGDKLWNDEQMAYFAEQVVSLTDQIQYENDKAERTALQDDLRAALKNLNQRRRTLEGDTESGKAFNRVKKSMKDCRDKLATHGMPKLAEHLRSSVTRVGSGFRYDPQPTVSWTLL